MIFRRVVLFFILVAPVLADSGPIAVLSTGRQADPTAKTLSEIRAAEKRRIPLEVQLKSASRYAAGGPVDVTIIVTNLFDAPLTMNSRMLVNHPLLPGEISMRILSPSGRQVDIQRLITPLSLRDQDFVVLTRGQSMQRAVDLNDLFGIAQRGIYKVQVAYRNEVDHVGSGHRAWKGVVWSEPAEIVLE